MPDILPKIFRLIQKSYYCHRNFNFALFLPATFFKTLPLTMISFHLLQTKLAWQISLKLRSLSIFSSISGGKIMLICSSGILFLLSLLILENWFSFVLSLAFWLSSVLEKTSVTKSANAFTVKSKIFGLTILLEFGVKLMLSVQKLFLQTRVKLFVVSTFVGLVKRK